MNSTRKKIARELLVGSVTAITLLIGPHAHAKRPAAPVDPSLIRVKVVDGERVSAFVISKSADRAQVSLATSGGTKASREISLQEYDFLKEKTQKLAGRSSDKASCRQRYVQVILTKRQHLACIGGKSKLAQGLQEIANILTVQF